MRMCGVLTAIAVLAVEGNAQASGTDRTIIGIVRETGTGEPLSRARVVIQGSPSQATQSDDQGRFRLRVPTGAVKLDVSHIGFSPLTIDVAARDTVASVVLNRVALNLDQIVVSGQATGVARRNLGTSVTTLAHQDLTRVDHQSIEQALQGKIPGAQISQRTGAPGGGNWVLLRGVSTVFGGTTTPLYVVDGVIVADTYVSNNQSRVTNGLASESPANRITDLRPDEIETIEVLKGSSAAAIYGSKASSGVVLITTRRGNAGRPRWSLRESFGTSALAYRNRQRRWSYEDAIAFFGQKAADYFDPITHEPFAELDYEDLAYGERPLNSDLSLSIGGGTADTRYFVSGAARDEGGIVARTGAQKYSVRANLDQVVGSRTTLQFNVSGTRSVDDRALFDNENSQGASVGYTVPRMPSFLDMRQNADGSWPINPFFPANPLQNVALSRNHDDVWRGIAGMQLRETLLESPRQDLRLVVIGGIDALMQRYDVFAPPELQSQSVLGNPGKAVVTDHRTFLTNLNVNGVHTWRPGGGLTLTTQVGTQYERWNQDVLLSSSANLAGGLEVVNAGATSTIAANDFRLRVEDFGLFAQSEWLFDSDFLVTLGARADRSTANADVGKFFIFPKASISWSPSRVVIPGLTDGLSASLLSSLKLRMAYGSTGNRPYYSDKYIPLAQGTVGGNTAYRPGTTLQSPDLRPERQEEVEGGFDASLFDSRASLELTLFRRTISDLLLTGTPAPSSGYTSSYSNGGKIRLTGVEMAVSAFPVRTQRLLWTTRATFGQNRSRVLALNGDTLTTFGSTPARGQIWFQPGHSATRLMGLDSLPAPNSVTYLGDGAPRWTGGISNEWRGGGWSVYVLFDHQEGGRLWSGTWVQYDLNRNARDYDESTPDGRKLGDVRRDAATKTADIYNQDVTYTKLRELSVALDLPAGLTKRIGAARSARLILSGRNLHTWTRFRGGDPEAENFFGGFGAQSLQHYRELAAYPASRQFWLTLQLEY